VHLPDDERKDGLGEFPTQHENFREIFLVSAGVASAVAALLSIHIGNPNAKDPRCTFFANPQYSPVRSYDSPFFGERPQLAHSLPILSAPTDADGIATANC
jgi:hypothetical protein